jgi:hypothetical protein
MSGRWKSFIKPSRVVLVRKGSNLKRRKVYVQRWRL